MTTTGFFEGVAEGDAEAVAGGDVEAVAEGEAEVVTAGKADVLAETEADDVSSPPPEHPEMLTERATSPTTRAPYARRALLLFFMPWPPLDIKYLDASRRDMPPTP
ncbi:hypothetical protein ABZ456_20450 [Streptomyces sp. NPDC005776]|uniref:hypothetical protein n=1 Tax=Streptomyces sp. NPDC005776 TaxID=3154676 RepID=UPI0033D93A93